MLAKIQQQDYRSLYAGFRDQPENVIADAKKAGCTLTHFLDRVSPPGYSAEPVSEDRTDVSSALEKAPVFQRLLHDENLPVNSNPLAGHYACQANEFFQTPFRRALFAELCYQRARAVWYGHVGEDKSRGKRALLFNTDVIPGEILNAFFDRPGALLDLPFQPAIPLSEIIAFTTFIPGQDYRALYFQRDADEHRNVRVPEGTPVPSGVLRHREHTISLPKRGRAIEFTYEVLRNPTTTIDRLLFQIQLMALETEVDLLEDSVKALRQGDGNTTGSTDTRPFGYHGSASAPAMANIRGSATYVYPEETADDIGKEERWLAFEMRFRAPFMLTRILSRTREALELKRLTLFPMAGGTGSGANAQAGYTSQELQIDLGGRSPFFPQLQPINPNAGIIRQGWLDPTDTTILTRNEILGFDHRLALERVVEVGSEIQEVETFVRSQTTVLVITENSGFAIFQPGSTAVLAWNDN